MSTLIRDAVRDDADAIAAAHIASWRAAYRHVFPATVFDADDFDSSRVEMWRTWSHSRSPDRRMQVAVMEGRVVGFAHTGDSDDPDSIDAADPADRFGELFGLYLHPDAWGCGAATMLMDSALQHLVDIGHRRAVVWTLMGSARARSFYSKSGWIETGQTGMWNHYPAHPVPELEYAHDLNLT